MAQDAQLISQASKVESLASDGLVSVSTGAGQPQQNMELAKFADSLGSSVPLQQNAEQVSITGLYARTSDGKMVELTKESVASVVSGLMKYNGGYFNKNLSVGGWYRISKLSNGSGGTVVMSNEYNNNKPASVGLYFSPTSIVCLGGGLFGDSPITKARIASVGGNVFLEVYYTSSRGNNVLFSFSNLINTQLIACELETEEVSVVAEVNFADNYFYKSLSSLSSDVAGQMGVKKIMAYETETGSDITTNINVNQGYYGGTIIAIASSHSSVGNATASEIKMIRCGYSENNVEETVISSLIKNANSGLSIASYSANQDGYLVINTKVRIARIKLFLF